MRGERKGVERKLRGAKEGWPSGDNVKEHREGREGGEGREAKILWEGV